MKVLILNGPPGCGKDTLAELLKRHGYAVASFKRPMFDIAIAMSGMSREQFMYEYNDRAMKEHPQPHLAGKSYREFMIHISEDVMKSLFGDSIFGERAAETCYAAAAEGFNVVFADGGFVDEVMAICEAGYDVTVVRLHRDGYTFNGDSRKYIYHPDVKTIDIALQDGMPKQAVAEILEKVR